MKNTVYSFRSRLVVLQEPDLFFEKTKSSRTSNSHGFLYFFESLHTCSPYQCLQSFSLVSFARLNKTEQSSFSEHLDPKLFLTFLLISTHSENKNNFQALSKALTRRTCKISEKINSFHLSWSSWNFPFFKQKTWFLLNSKTLLETI